MTDQTTTKGNARWSADEFEGDFSLEIDLGNDHAATLITRGNGEPPSVILWCGSGEHSFLPTDCENGETLETFRAWVACAQRRRGGSVRGCGAFGGTSDR